MFEVSSGNPFRVCFHVVYSSQGQRGGGEYLARLSPPLSKVNAFTGAFHISYRGLTGKSAAHRGLQTPRNRFPACKRVPIGIAKAYFALRVPGIINQVKTRLRGSQPTLAATLLFVMKRLSRSNPPPGCITGCLPTIVGRKPADSRTH